MNLCFLIGKIITNVEFKFVLNSKNVSIVIFKIKINENCSVIVKAYNEIADWCYQKLIKGDFVAIQGSLNGKMEVVINSINLLF